MTFCVVTNKGGTARERSPFRGRAFLFRRTPLACKRYKISKKAIRALRLGIGNSKSTGGTMNDIRLIREKPATNSAKHTFFLLKFSKIF